jgi:uncharacterized protein YceK
MNTIAKLLIIAVLLTGCGKVYTATEIKDSYHVVTYIDSEHGNICYLFVSDLAATINTPVSISCLPLR